MFDVHAAGAVSLPALTTAQDVLFRADGGGPLSWGVDEPGEHERRLATDLGLTPARGLHEMRRLLPAGARAEIATRAFVPGRDDDAWLAVNNRAFAWHPEQSGMSRERFDAIAGEPWFEPEGLRLFERDGELLGFCWTTVHDDAEPVLGEIYVIAVDPSAHGQGLGGPMTRAGLDHLSSKGFTVGMLYVESDNLPANRTYERIGFFRHHTDRAYRRTIEPSPS